MKYDTLRPSRIAPEQTRVKDLFTPLALTETALHVERIVAEAQGALGIIPKGAARTIAENCRLDRLDFANVDADFERTRHPLVPLLRELERVCGEAGAYVHWGLTTQNVVQTALLLQARTAHGIELAVLEETLRLLGALARTYAASPMAGRTHGRHAVPITFGYKVATWIDELIDAAARLKEAGSRAFRVMMGGSVGCYSILGQAGPPFQAEVARRLEMEAMPLPSRSIRAPVCDYFCAVVVVVTVLHKIAEEVFQTGGEEFGEVREGFVEGSVGSSTMPQKNNPVFCFEIIAESTSLYGQLHAMIAIANRPFEADAGAGLIYDNGIRDALTTAIGIFARARDLIQRLEVHPERMRANLTLSDGAIYSEAAMMQLARSRGRGKGHEIVRGAFLDARGAGVSFQKALSASQFGSEIADILQDGEFSVSRFGLCKEYALHYAAIVDGIADGGLPSAQDRMPDFGQ